MIRSVFNTYFNVMTFIYKHFFTNIFCIRQYATKNNVVNLRKYI
jgi:hypothetical protein